MRLGAMMIPLAVVSICVQGALAADQDARDWYVKQKRIQKEARIAAAQNDAATLYALEGQNFDHRHNLQGAWGAKDGPCETYQLRVFRMIENAKTSREWKSSDDIATKAGDACWAAIGGR